MKNTNHPLEIDTVYTKKTEPGKRNKGIPNKDALVYIERVTNSYAEGNVPAMLCVPPPRKFQKAISD